MERSARTSLPKLTDRYALGASGLKVSPFCLGVVTDRRIVPCAFDAGINFFFVSADLHWPVYEELRRGLALLLERGAHVRDQIVVAGVSYITQSVFAGTNFDEVVREVPGLERLDVLIAGGAYDADFADRRTRLAGSPFAGELGARAFGASFHVRTTALAAMNDRLVDIAFVRYNPSHPGSRRDLFPQLRPAPRPLLYNFRSVPPPLTAAQWRTLGLDDDHWLPEPPDYYRYALTRPEVNGILGSLSTPLEVQALVDALAHGPLDAEEEEYMETLAALADGRARIAGAA